MALIKINEKQKLYLIIATVLALLAGAWLLTSYLMLIIFSAVIVILFNPVYTKLLKKNMKPGKAAMLTFFIALLVVIIPVALILFMTVLQVQSVAKDIAAGNYGSELANLVNNIINSINNLFTDIGVSYRISIDNITASLSSLAEEISKSLLEGLKSTIGGFFSFLTTSIIFIYVFISMLVNQDKIMSIVKKLNPLGDEISELYTQRIEAMTKATVRGQFIIAFWQGTVSAVVLALTGLSDLFFFFWIVLTAFSVIPLGAGIITIPIGIIMILTGNVWQGVVVILNHVLIVTNIDNVLRPKLVPKSARLDSAIMILAVFSGMAIFGFFGIVLGPVIMIMLMTTIQLFLEVFKNTEAIERDEDGKKPRSKLMSKIKFWDRSSNQPTE